MIRMSATFLILAAVTLIGACAAMMLRGLVHCALALAVAFAGLGTLYLNLGAQFLGLAQLLVYLLLALCSSFFVLVCFFCGALFFCCVGAPPRCVFSSSPPCPHVAAIA